MLFVSQCIACGEASNTQPACSIELCTKLMKEHSSDQYSIGEAGYEHCLPIAKLAPVNKQRNCREEAIVLDCGPHVRVNGYAQLNETHAYYMGPDGSCWDGDYNLPPDFKATDNWESCPGDYLGMTCKQLDEIEAYEKMNAK